MDGGRYYRAGSTRPETYGIFYEQNPLVHKIETIQTFFNLFADYPWNFLSADHPRPHGTNISRLSQFYNLSPSYPA